MISFNLFSPQIIPIKPIFYFCTPLFCLVFGLPEICIHTPWYFLFWLSGICIRAPQYLYSCSPVFIFALPGICVRAPHYLYSRSLVFVFVLPSIYICAPWYLYSRYLVFVFVLAGICICAPWYLYSCSPVFVFALPGICIRAPWYLYSGSRPACDNQCRHCVSKLCPCCLGKDSNNKKLEFGNLSGQFWTLCPLFNQGWSGVSFTFVARCVPMMPLFSFYAMALSYC